MRALFVHAHYDDYEFSAAGAFERCRQEKGADFAGRILVCTDGAAGHHRLSRSETARVRRAEQTASARLGGYDWRLLRLPGGRVPREGCLEVSRPLLAALWKAIREFEPDYLFCPPLPRDPLAGVHVDHLQVAEAVRRVAYLINVPRAFSPEYRGGTGVSKRCRVPVILNVFDTYAGEGAAYDLVIDIEAAFERVAQMSWCHQSQIREWLPWVGRHQLEPPSSMAEWRATLRERWMQRQRGLGVRGSRAVELFQVTAWGELPTVEQLSRDLPGLRLREGGRPLRARLACWRRSSFG